MTKQEIISQAIRIMWPRGDEKLNTLKRKGPQYHFLPPVDLRYKGMRSNDHHFTVEYHKKYVYPLYEKILGFKIDWSKWKKVSNIIDQEDKKFDLSYYSPKKEFDKDFYVECFSPEISYDCKFSGLLVNDLSKDATWSTPYHRLYAFPHLSSRIVNKSHNNGKRLLILGDSQSVPDIAILSYHFKEVWYVDNRKNIPILDKMKNANFDCVVISAYTRTIGNGNEKYHEDFLI